MVSLYLRMSIMSISPTSASTDEVQESLTSPFIQKKVTIHSETPYDELEEIQETFSKSFFETKSHATLRYDIDTTYQIVESSKEFVENSVNAGYSAEEAIQLYKAQNIYASTLGMKVGVSRISHSLYDV